MKDLDELKRQTTIDLRTAKDQRMERDARAARDRPILDTLMAALGELRGKVLGCWCKPRACHGDILARLADQVRL